VILAGAILLTKRPVKFGSQREFTQKITESGFVHVTS